MPPENKKIKNKFKKRKGNDHVRRWSHRSLIAHSDWLVRDLGTTNASKRKPKNKREEKKEKKAWGKKDKSVWKQELTGRGRGGLKGKKERPIDH